MPSYIKRALKPYIQDNKNCVLILPLLFITLIGWKVHAQPPSVYEVERVITNRPHGDRDKRLEYSFQLLTLALETTKAEYGPFELLHSFHPMYRDRQFIELRKGKSLHVTISPPKKGRDSEVLRVPFPLLRGLGGIRINMMLEKNRDILKDVNSVSDLKKFSVGANTHWSTTFFLGNMGFHVVNGDGYASLFKMLNHSRFELFPRGVNEIYSEYDEFKRTIDQLVIDPYIAVIMYLPSYFYVSPKKEKLAKRLENGLIKAHKSGDLARLFNRFYSETLRRAGLDKRKLIYIKNTDLTPEMFKNDKPYLLDVFHKIEY